MFEILKAKALGLINSQDHTAEVHLGAYAGGILALIVSVCWWTVMGPRDMALVAALGVLAGAITGGLFKKGSNAAAPTEPAPTGAPNQEGEKQ